MRLAWLATEFHDGPWVRIDAVEELLWERESVSTVHAGRLVVREHAARLPDGTRTTYEVDESIPFAVAVLVQPEPGRVVLARQYRFPLDRWIHDLPGGTGDPGESPEQTARRECEEEVGLVPGALVHLQTTFLNPGRTAWPVHLYFADDVSAGTRDTSDPSEEVRHVVLEVAEVDRLVDSGEVVDASLLIAWATARRRGAPQRVTVATTASHQSWKSSTSSLPSAGQSSSTP